MGVYLNQLLHCTDEEIVCVGVFKNVLWLLGLNSIFLTSNTVAFVLYYAVFYGQMKHLRRIMPGSI